MRHPDRAGRHAAFREVVAARTRAVEIRSVQDLLV